MLAIVRRICTKKFIEKVPATCSKVTNFSRTLTSLRVKSLCCDEYQKSLQFYRYKSKSKNKSTKKESETETEESDKDFLDEVQDKYTKTVKVNVTSMRLDVVLKAGLGLSRNKLEGIFYESKIRLNGEKVLKKSIHVQEGDEIDVIKGTNVNNKDLLTVAKVEILAVVPKEESISVKMRRSKSLIIENYQGSNRWEEST